MTTETRTEPTTVPLIRERTASDVLLAAARYIEEHGWCQDNIALFDGRVCALGAINAVTGRDPWDGDQAEAPRSRLVLHLGAYVPEWNDTPGRTEAEVLAALRAAAGVS